MSVVVACDRCGRTHDVTRGAVTIKLPERGRDAIMNADLCAECIYEARTFVTTQVQR